jgi:antitoxin component HigA of HigAB toxin-antitoxin module
MSMVSQFTMEYMEQLDVQTDNLVEVSMIRDLVDQEVQYLRKTKLLAKEHFVQENVIGVDDNGSPILKKELHLAVELEDKLHKRRKDLRNQLLATREAKAKAGQMQMDSAQAISDILYKVQSIQIEKEKLLKQKLGTYELDEYIESQVVEEEDNKNG